MFNCAKCETVVPETRETGCGIRENQRILPVGKRFVSGLFSANFGDANSADARLIQLYTISAR
jgi:hypothetical protein